MKKIIAVFLVLFCMVVFTAPARPRPNDATIIGDVLLARPLGLAMIAADLFCLSLPFPSHCRRQRFNVGQRLVLDPVEFTFIRPVGNFDYRLGTWQRGDDWTN